MHFFTQWWNLLSVDVEMTMNKDGFRRELESSRRGPRIATSYSD